MKRFPGIFALVGLLLLHIGINTLSQGQIIEYTTDIKVDPPKLTTEYAYLIRINSRDMDGLAEVNISYQEGDDVDILEAVILGADGKVVRSIGKKEIKTRHNISEGSFFEDDWIQEFNLNWNQYPYRIRYRYRITTNKFTYVCYWIPGTSRTVSTERASLTVRYPSDFRVRIHQPDNASADSTVTRNQVERRWLFTSVSPIKREKLSLPVRDLWQWVIIAPLKFNYGVPGSMASWNTYGEWQYRLNEGANDLPPFEKQKVGAIVEKTPNKRDQIRQLYHYVQDNTRYINVAMDVGGMKSYPASYVSSRKYGDCKALTTFMKSLLEAAGIPSYYANVNGADNPSKILDRVPGPQFNHMILCVPLGKDTVWLENTSNSLPSGYLGTFTQNRQALILDPVDSRLVSTPALSPEQVKCVRRIEYDVRTNEISKATARWELRGDEFERIKATLLNRKETEVREVIEADLPTRDHRLARWRSHQENRDSPELTLDLELEATNLVRKLGNTLVIRPPSNGVPEMEAPGSRTTPVRINYPVLEEETLIYRLPDIEKLAIELPKPFEVNTPFGRYTGQARVDGATVIVQRRFSFSAGFIPLDHYKEFYAFISAIRDADRTFAILLKPKS
jgi:transglutaminase-like putative cysteine protease